MGGGPYAVRGLTVSPPGETGDPLTSRFRKRGLFACASALRSAFSHARPRTASPLGPPRGREHGGAAADGLGRGLGPRVLPSRPVMRRPIAALVCLAVATFPAAGLAADGLHARGNGELGRRAPRPHADAAR